MGAINYKDNVVEVICQHKADGSIIPIKFKTQDENGEHQTFQIRGYKVLDRYTTSENGPQIVTSVSHIHRFQCKIEVLGELKIIGLSYNAFDGKWRIFYNFN